MPLFLSTRDTESHERMDDPHCDQAELINTYRQFSTINSMISGWRQIYKRTLRPLFSDGRPYTLLDIGFGGGDIPIKLARWAAADGIDLRITGIETDERALAFVRTIDSPPGVTFRHIAAEDLLAEGTTFDVVISNHLVHHLPVEALRSLLHTARGLSTRAVVFNDIERSDWAYLLFNLFARPVFWSSFITNDGLTSIKRSFTRRELQRTVPEGWHARRRFPFRLLLEFYHG